MKKTIWILAILVIVSCTISVITNQNNGASDGGQVASSVTTVTTATEQTEASGEAVAKVKISSDEYFDLVNTTIKNCIEPEGYVVSRTSTLRTPYYQVDCTATTADTTNFKADVLRIAENIYNILLQHEYQRRSIFLPSHEIISITFLAVLDSETTNALTIQFDLTDIDETKSFLDNLKIQITP